MGDNDISHVERVAVPIITRIIRQSLSFGHKPYPVTASSTLAKSLASNASCVLPTTAQTRDYQKLGHNRLLSLIVAHATILFYYQKIFRHTTSNRNRLVHCSYTARQRNLLLGPPPAL